MKQIAPTVIALTALSLFSCGKPPADSPLLGSWKTGGNGGLFNSESVEMIYRFKKDGKFQRHITVRDLIGQRDVDQEGTWKMDGETMHVTIKGNTSHLKMAGHTSSSITWIVEDGSTQQWNRIGDR